jgi:hypothetical protein
MCIFYDKNNSPFLHLTMMLSNITFLSCTRIAECKIYIYFIASTEEKMQKKNIKSSIKYLNSSYVDCLHECIFGEGYEMVYNKISILSVDLRKSDEKLRIILPKKPSSSISNTH